MLLREQTREVFIHPDFEELSESTLLSIVKEDTLNISELELFDAVKRWARYQCTQRGLEINGTHMREVYILEYLKLDKVLSICFISTGAE